MQVVGVVGGIASGKSLITRQLADRGAGVLDADRAGHEALRLPAVELAARSGGARESSARTDGSTASDWRASYLRTLRRGRGNVNISNN